MLPAIQREFVWSTEKVRMLFDSLLRGYPIGSFLFWKVEPDQAKEFTFYDFVRDYHEKDSPYAPAFKVPPGHGVIAILDGQQRLTSLNMGLHGSHAERQPRKWAANPDAYPKKRLSLDLLGEGSDEELGMQYEFRFLTAQEAAPEPGGPDRWYRVGDVLSLADSGPAIMADLERRRLGGKQPFQVLYDLYRAMREAPLINYYLEESQDSDKVLDIFVRVNSAGTPLSYSDLLLSMATNQWQELDAREEVRSLLTALNGGSTPFDFTKDLVLKAGLMLIDAPDIRFKVSNFTKTNMALMEKRWPEIRSALMIAADLLASFGYSERTLSAGSVLIPIAYYVFIRGLDSRYVSSGADAAERQAMRFWVTRSLMKRGVWGSGLDTLLGRQRDVIREHGTTRFPVEELETAMASLGKSLRFDDAEVEELSELRYGRPRTFATLAILYPGLDLTKVFHEDHIFPRSLFTRPKLKKAGIDPIRISEYIDRVDGLPNLQLLAGVPNTEKQAKLPEEWLAGPQFPDKPSRLQYMQENDLSGLPLDLEDFLDFHEGRRERIETRLRVLLGVGARMEPVTEREAADDAGAEDGGLNEGVELPDELPDVGNNWSHEEIRDWVRTDFVRSLVDGFEQWLLEVGGPTGEMRHGKRTRHAFYVGRKRIVAYYFAHTWMHFWLPHRTESDVVAFRGLSDADAVHVNPERPSISGKIAVETDLSILQDRIRERVQLILREGAKFDG